MYEKDERFGSFCDRAIQAARPNWLFDEQKLRINELMYNIIVDKKVSFKKTKLLLDVLLGHFFRIFFDIFLPSNLLQMEIYKMIKS